jgi:hypothetical protein
MNQTEKITMKQYSEFLDSVYKKLNKNDVIVSVEFKSKLTEDEILEKSRKTVHNNDKLLFNKIKDTFGSFVNINEDLLIKEYKNFDNIPNNVYDKLFNHYTNVTFEKIKIFNEELKKNIAMNNINIYEPLFEYDITMEKIKNFQKKLEMSITNLTRITNEYNGIYGTSHNVREQILFKENNVRIVALDTNKKIVKVYNVEYDPTDMKLKKMETIMDKTNWNKNMYKDPKIHEILENKTW